MRSRQPWSDQTEWLSKISRIAQVGGIETAVADDGPARGSRIAWVNTGSGLRYKVLLDRGMDIGDASYDAFGLAWLSAAGFAPPQPWVGRGTDWLRYFGGGLLTTCGLEHVGGPESDEFGERGQHGLISHQPAALESLIQPDPANDRWEMSIMGLVQEVKVMGTRLQLRRKISSRLGEPFIRIGDEVKNTGNMSAPHMLLYHINFGWPLLDEGARLHLPGEPRLLDAQRDGRIYGADRDFTQCPPPLKEHRGGGQAAAWFDMPCDEYGEVVTGITNPRIGIGLRIRYRKDQLPWLTNWQHWGRGEYVAAIEPCTHPPVGPGGHTSGGQPDPAGAR